MVRVEISRSKVRKLHFDRRPVMAYKEIGGSLVARWWLGSWATSLLSGKRLERQVRKRGKSDPDFSNRHLD
jgi:hypothetical protein